MGIAYFPEIYEDELFYSVIGRYYDHSGYISFTGVLDDCFQNSKIRIDKEFIKNLKPEIISVITRQLSLEQIVEDHTMYAYYGKFLEKERQLGAKNALLSMSGDFSKLLGVPQNRTREKRYLKLCPMCVFEDRKNVGEAYIHRNHQLWNVKVCMKHNCYLVDTGVSMDSKTGVVAQSAEYLWKLQPSEVRMCENDTEMRYAKYNVDLFHSSVDENLRIHQFIRSKLAGTVYRSHRGESCYFNRLFDAMKVYYKGTSVMDGMTEGHIQRLLLGKRIVFHEISAVLLFLEIDGMELEVLQRDDITENFDKEVEVLVHQGKHINEIARNMNVSPSIIRYSIDQMKKENSTVQKNYSSVNRKGYDWNRMDREMFPIVQEKIRKMKVLDEHRPQKISNYAIRKKLGLAQHYLDHMKLCREEIEKNQETDEEYHARKIVWALQQMEKMNYPIKWWRITSISKVEKDKFFECMEELKQMISEKVIEEIMLDMQSLPLTDTNKRDTIIAYMEGGDRYG